MPGAESLSVHQPVMKAGDVVIWNNLLPHGSGQNTSDAPRIGYNLSLNPIGTVTLHSFGAMVLRDAALICVYSTRARIENDFVACVCRDPRSFSHTHGMCACLDPSAPNHSTSLSDALR